ncbi:hypothetical protein Mgra_00002079 [Meloidogyne graminicola]|nr:hypothetical protein Mgra_00002079 [Meloidogyne graminicola]
MEHPRITSRNLENEDEDDSNALLVNMEKKSVSTRSICKDRKEYKKPKFGLEMLKEHIKSSVEKTTKETTSKCDKIEEIKDESVNKVDDILENIPKNEVVDKKAIEEDVNETGIETDEEPNKIEVSDDLMQHDIRKIREFVVNLPSTESKSPSVVPLWNGCISIDDISSTDDEAEIDAVLEEQHNLKKMALEREKELKGRELPPTSALSRPLVHKRDVVVSLQEALMSPNGGVSDLLQQSIQQQFLSSSTSQQQQQSNNNTTRPYAAVAPCQITTPTFTATTITGTMAQQVQQTTVMSLVSQIAASVVNTQEQRIIGRKNKYRTFSKTYSPSINNKQIFPFQNRAISQSQQPILMQLRERYRQTSKLYSDMLEEQLLLLAQIQKMSSNPDNADKIKILMFRSKNLEKNSQQLKKQLEVLSASFVENVKK